MQTKVKSKFKILDFDIECRPLSWYGGDWVTKEVTAICAQWIGDKKPSLWLLGEVSPEEMFSGFLELYNEAGMVTGHYIRGFDLPVLNGAITEVGFAPLQSKLTQDTKLDLIKRQGLSGSQENLASMFGLENDKIGMTQEDWRQANRLTKIGLEKVKERVVGDVKQHIEMRQKLLDLSMLGPPRVWNGSNNAQVQYTP